MLVSVFVGTSVDGFLARPDDTYDFLFEGENVPHGYDEFIASVDAIVLGRRTFEIVRAFPSWPYPARLRVVVLSNSGVDFSGIESRVEHMNGAPKDIVGKLAAENVQHVYVDGGATIQRFMRDGLVDRLIVTRVPVLIGAGIPLFGPLLRDVKLRHVDTHIYAGGLVKSEYAVLHDDAVAPAN